MKTFNLTHLVLSAGITLALAATLAFPLSSNADQQLKGGQLQIGERVVQYQPLAPLDLHAGSAACPACTNSVQPFATSAGRGAFVKTGVIVTHLCSSCKTAIVTAGVGKAKTETAVHTCGNGQTASCCSGMAGM